MQSSEAPMLKKAGFDFDDVAAVYGHLDKLTTDLGDSEEGESRIEASEKESLVASYLVPILGILLLVAVFFLIVCLYKRERMRGWPHNKSESESCTSWNTNSLKDLEAGKSDHQKVQNASNQN